MFHFSTDFLKFNRELHAINTKKLTQVSDGSEEDGESEENGEEEEQALTPV